MLTGKRVLLIIGGGIAAYKSLDLIRKLRGQAASVRCILTAGGRQFVTPLSAASLSGDKVYTELFDLTDEAEMGHIQLSRDADLLVVAPATADLMAKMAHGLADDLATTALLATDKPVLIAPAMNVRMWQHAATRRNLATLRGDGVMVIGPNEGDMACGEYGPGRMAEPEEILAAITAALAPTARPLSGLRALVTSGPTHEPIDPVRYIANRSSGKQGHAIAAALAMLGAETVLVSGPVHEATPPGVAIRKVETACEMLEACKGAGRFDIAVCAAAVADWRVESQSGRKIKKRHDGGAPKLVLTENPDILLSLSQNNASRPRLVIGFAAETNDVITHAREKRTRKGCDWIVANDVSPETGIMGGDFNTVHLLTGEGLENWPPMSKTDVAARLAQRIAEHFAVG
ncbi:MAG: bifunctional phosphopantothenoylcysteine decarboxylase/phosphopantothenate--cysteine ligase CoaBC [Alphaproteobacteria bacterium]|nr:bifunctional phosphopantothenoylcysteine decarboxylase/phosphopantothenate--cysteine ligase CoaBC [Alphaproteobacteria bacterium]